MAKPRFNFRDTTTNPAKFTATAIKLEDTGVSAYAGQAPHIKADGILRAALSVHTVEARHASWIRHIAAGGSLATLAGARSPAPRAFDRPLSRAQVLAAVKATGFILPRR